MTKITMKSGKVYEGFWNGKIYNGEIYLNKPNNGNIMVDGCVSGRSKIVICTDDVESGLNIGLPKTTAGWMAEMERAER